MSQGGASFEYRGGAKLRHHSQSSGDRRPIIYRMVK